MNFEPGKSYFVERGFTDELGGNKVYQGERVCFSMCEGLDYGVFFNVNNKRLVLPLQIFQRTHTITYNGKEYEVTREQIDAIINTSEG